MELYRVNRNTKRKPAGIKLRCLQIRLYSSVFSDYDGAMTHATRGSEGGQSRREDADCNLDDGLPSLFLHSD